MSKASYRARFVASIVTCLCLLLAPQLVCAQEGGSLSITSQDTQPITYTAIRIADTQGNPQEDALDWDQVAALTVDNTSLATQLGDAHTSAFAAGLSKLLAQDTGTLADQIATHARPNPSITYSITTNAAPTPVQNGWYLMRAEGKRTLFVWVNSKPLTLTDKTSTPTLIKRVQTPDGTYGTRGFIGAGTPAHFELRATVPEESLNLKTFWVEFSDEWDEGLVLVPESMTLSLSHEGTDQALDVPVTFTQTAQSFTFKVEDLKRSVFSAGDELVLSYDMTLADTAHTSDQSNWNNEAYLRFPKVVGEGETPHESNSVGGISLRIHKVSRAGQGLAGAVFALRRDGLWLQPSLEFGAEATRATFTTDQNGLINTFPKLAPGRYQIVELQAPESYTLPLNPVTEVVIEGRYNEQNFELKLESSNTSTLESVDATTMTAQISIVNSKTPFDWPLPDTSDKALIGFEIVLLGMSLVATAMVLKRNGESHE